MLYSILDRQGGMKISNEVSMKSYIFDARVQKEEDGRWSCWIDALPGCAAWGYSREEALEALKDAAELYIQDMIEEGEELPREGVQIIESPVIAVNL
jgi:predicted RNase H-like HicB family nuclease